jgi:hypothetical protein
MSILNTQMECIIIVIVTVICTSISLPHQKWFLLRIKGVSYVWGGEGTLVYMQLINYFCFVLR